jgi:N-methylhydantoinase B
LTQTQPQQIASGSADLVVVEMLRSNLDALMEEMLHLLVRSAYSTLMRESRDCSFLITDEHGRVVTSNPANFVHATAYRPLVQSILEKWGREGIREGDVIVANHPYLASVPHTPDLAVAVPVFVDSELIGFSCTIAHKPDFGGAVPGSNTSKSTELYQEGFLLPLTKLYDAGVYRQELEDILVVNVRHPDLVLGDTRAQIGTTRVGANRLAQLARRYGLGPMRAAFDELLRLCDRRMRATLATWPDGTHSAEGYTDNDGVRLDTPVKFHVQVIKQGDSIHFDLSGSDDQTLGPVNMRPPWVEVCAYYTLLSMLDPDLRFNDGVRESVTLTLREGSVVNPRIPGPVGAGIVSSYRLMDVMLEALSYFAPDRAVAQSGGSGGPTAITWEPASPGQRSLLQYEIFGTGLGGHSGGDGASGVVVHTANLTSTPIEILENTFPLRVRRFELVKDSAGAGEFRGGLCYRREYELLRGATINRRADRTRFASDGVLGGKPGQLGRLVRNPGRPDEEILPGAGLYQMAAGATVRFEGSGAGGFGDPFDRDPEAVAHDVSVGYVSIEAAEREYGVVLEPRDLTVDLAATKARRDQRS